jgi:hypothetical protein
VVPFSLPDLSQIVQQVVGVRFSDLVDRLPRRAPDPQTALDQVLSLAAQADVGDTARLITERDDMLSALHTSLTHPDPETREAAERVLNLSLPALASYRPELTAVLRRIHAGERDADLLVAGLGGIDRAIAERALAYLAGDPTLGIDPDAWQARRQDTDEAEDRGYDAMADMMVAARGGDTEILSFIERGLEQLGNDPVNAAFVAALREVIDGGNPSLSVNGLDPAQAGVLDAIRHRITNSTRPNDQ